jgi:hypothetical protein
MFGSDERQFTLTDFLAAMPAVMPVVEKLNTVESSINERDIVPRTIILL